ncbi:phage major capsid protein [Roseobacter sp. CCS2]|uniref:phage major capsid protein n=1 Tax=Roseobacter sp. CCS2 TaxID=391593 RepID=UPI00056557B0|nr:phage major capsid protein [Roseobacter sp. CCS2]
MDLDDLRRLRAEALATMETAATAIEELETAETAADDEAMVAALAAFEEAETAFAASDRRVRRVESVEQAAAASASGGDNSSAAPGTVPAAASNPAENGLEIGFMMHALTNARGDRDRACAALEENGHSGISAALSGATDAAGGVTIPRAQSEQIIELLRPMVAVRALGARVMPMPAGQVRHAQLTGSATASYGPENGAAIESEQTFAPIDQAFKTLKALVPVGNALLRHSTAAVAALIRDDMLQVMRLREDLGFMRDAGAANTPFGLRFWTPVANLLTGVANDAAAVETAIRFLVSRVEDANVMMVSPGWIMRAGTKNFLASLREPVHGSYLFPSIQEDGELMGYPIKTTSQIPANLGVGANETEVYFADFNEVMIGDAMTVTIATSSEAAFVDQGGNTVSAFQNDLTLMRAISEHDLAPRHVEALSGLNGVNWTL